MGTLYQCDCNNCQYSQRLALGTGLLGSRQVIIICEECKRFGRADFICPTHETDYLHTQTELSPKEAHDLRCPTCETTGNLECRITGLWD